MIQTGFVFENPRTQSRSVVLESDAETAGMGWLIEVTLFPGAGADTPEHLHLTWTETFEIIQGTAYYKLDGVQHTLQPGERVTMPPRQRHMHPWSASDSALVYRQRTDLGQRNPAGVQEFLGAFATLAGLARAGKANKRGMPTNPLQLAATLQIMAKHGTYDSTVPIAAQNLAAATLGRLAHALGYRGVDPQYVG